MFHRSTTGESQRRLTGTDHRLRCKYQAIVDPLTSGHGAGTVIPLVVSVEQNGQAIGEDVLPRPVHDEPVAHGYTLAQINGMAVYAARACNWVNGMEMTHRAEVAWSAIVESLCEADEPPRSLDLIDIGWKAMKAQYAQDLRAHGRGGRDKSQESLAFVRFWWSAASPTGSPEDAVVDRLAFWQIWSALTPKHREVLRALADHDCDRHAAARALGTTVNAVDMRLRKARHAFYVLWHEGEQPSKRWGVDRKNNGKRPRTAMRVLRVRKYKQAKLAEAAAT